MKAIPRADWARLMVMLAVGLGAFMRFHPTLTAGYAVGDGGMFAVMIDDLRASGYTLPTFTTYNDGGIPYAYPPLGFYAGGLAADLLGLTAPEALRWVPAFFASLSVLAFYLLASRLMKEPYAASTATLFFALMPRALSWFVSGGGLTRSPGQFFMLLTFASAIRLYEEGRRRDIAFAGTFAGLTILSHPEAAVHMIASLIFFWFMLARSRTAFVRLATVGLIAATISAPWWAVVLQHHGMEPFLSAAQTGQKALAVLNLLSFDFTEEVFATLIAVLGLLGLLSHLVRRQYVLPLWLLLPFLVEGRSAVLPAAIPLAMLASTGLLAVIFPPLISIAKEGSDPPQKLSGVELGVFLYLVVFLTFSTYFFGSRLAQQSLNPSDRQAMEWVRLNTPDDARFLVLTGTDAITCDLVLEWFPALTQRRSLYTVQGSEWTRGADFGDYVRSTYAVQACLSSGDLACVDAVVPRADYEYMYIARQASLHCETIALQDPFHAFVESLEAGGIFRKVFQSDRVFIFAQ